MSENATVIGDDVASLIMKNLRLASRIAFRFYRKRKNLGVELDDFEGAARLGLCDAARRFDPSKSSNFSTFAYLRIRGAMYDLLRRSSGISRCHYLQLVDPKAAQLKNARARQLKKKELENLPYQMTNDTRELLKLSAVIEDYGLCLHFNRESNSLDISYAGTPTPEKVASERSVKRYLKRLLQDLPERERMVIEHKYYAEESFDQMRESFGGVTTSWLSRLHARAIANLRLRLEREMRATRVRQEWM